MAAVTFVKSFAGYNEGETATFYAERAEALIKSGVAVEYVAPEEPEPAKPKKKKSSPDESQPESQF